MLLSLASWLQTLGPEYGFLRVFQYITFRAVMAAMTSVVIGLIAYPFAIRHFASLSTTRGMVTLLSITVSMLLWFDLANRFVWIVLLVTLGLGVIRWADKTIELAVMAGSALGVLAYLAGSAVYSESLSLPYIPGAGELLIFCSALAGVWLALIGTSHVA